LVELERSMSLWNYDCIVSIFYV